MFQFLQPIALMAAAGIIVPVIVHLWNVRQGRILKIGSISLLQQSDRQQARSLKLKDLLLLLLRCLLILLIALLLARPQFIKQLTVADEKGWILIPRNDVTIAYEAYRNVIDSLLIAGYQFRYFEKNFTAEIFADALANNQVDDTPLQPYWQIIESLNKQVPKNLPVYLFTDNLLNRFTGNRPLTSLNITWKTFIPKDTNAVYYKDAYLINSDEAIVAMATSKPVGTTINVQQVGLGKPINNIKLVEKEGRSLVVNNEWGNDSFIRLDTTVTNIVIYADKNYEDAAYIKASLEAIRAAVNFRLAIRVIKDVSDLPQETEWLFWLSEQQTPVNKKYKKIFAYKYGKEQSLYSYINFNLQFDHADKEIILNKRVPVNNATNYNRRTIWKDGFGAPLLEVENAQSQVYYFYSRFKPAWNDLVWSPAFPGIIFNLLFQKDKQKYHHPDKRKIDETQVIPVNGDSYKASFVKQIDLADTFWLMAFVVLLFERLLSYKRKKEVTNGK